MIRVLVADDQALVREGLMTLLATVEGIEPVASAADGLDATTLTAELNPNVVLMDLRMPTIDGVQATRRIKARHPDVEVVVLTTHADDASIIEALGAGARGYLTKDSGIADIARAIFAAANHQSLLDPQVQARLLAAATSAAVTPAALTPGTATQPAATTGQSADTAPTPTCPRDPPDDLTARELEVLRLVAQGLSNSEIAAQLVVSESTVKTHINHLFSKIGARDRAQAVHYAYSHGLNC